MNSHNRPMKLEHPTLTQFILQQEARTNATGELSNILLDIGVIGKIISHEMNHAGLKNIFGHIDRSNESGDTMKKMDLLSHELFCDYLEASGHFAGMASEEEALFMPINNSGKYVIAFDPLDGSSNIDYNVSVGSVFSIHRRVSHGSAATEIDFLQPGNTQVAAGYIVYGSSTIFVYSAGDGVHGFTLDHSIGEWLLSHKNIQIPAACAIYSANESYYNSWDEISQKFLSTLKETFPSMTSRYIGSLIADIHRNILTGGIFFRPYDDAKEKKAKLRLTYEVKPMAFLIEQAGGYATTGSERILDIIPESLHQTVPFIAGNSDVVREYESQYRLAPSE